MSPKVRFITGAFALLTAVGTGAFGAHGLKAYVDASALQIWETAVLYQLVHGLGLLGLALAGTLVCERALSWASMCLTAGILIFSGSLYILVLTGTHWLGAITPIGGLAFMAGWAIAIVGALRRAS